MQRFVGGKWLAPYFLPNLWGKRKGLVNIFSFASFCGSAWENFKA